MKSLRRIRLFATLWTLAYQACPSMGFSRQEYCNGVAISFSRRSFRPRDWTRISRIIGRHFTVWPTRGVQFLLYAPKMPLWYLPLLNLCVCLGLVAQLSNSLWFFRLEPTRLLSPWDSPGKNTGVGCRTHLPGTFVTQGLNLCLLCLSHCWETLNLLKGFPFTIRKAP